MSGTLTISETQKNYNVLGRGPDSSGASSGLSLVQLVRGRKYQRIEDIRKTAAENFFDIIVILPRNDALPYEELVSEYSNLRLMFFDPEFYEQCSVGALINAGMSEAVGELVMVLWNGVDINIDKRAISRVERDVLCHLPHILDSKGVEIPSLFVPAPVKKGKRELFVEPMPVIPTEDEMQSLFPYDYSGIYVKERFNRCGGFDEEMKNAYWQKLEFGYRAWLWGERLRYLPGFQIHYSEKSPVEESTPDEDYLRFYLRIIAVSYSADRAVLPLSQFWSYLFAGKKNIIAAWQRFTDIKRWVEDHSYNYRLDVLQMVDLWGEDV